MKKYQKYAIIWLALFCATWAAIDIKIVSLTWGSNKTVEYIGWIIYLLICAVILLVYADLGRADEYHR